MNLSDPISSIAHIGPAYLKKLEKLDIYTVEDLLIHIPHRYLDFRIKSDISSLQLGEIVTVTGDIISVKNTYTKFKKNFQIFTVKDHSGEISVIFFNQPYLTKSIQIGDKISFAGEVGTFNYKKALISPEFEVVKDNETLHTGRLVPIYPETANLSSKWLRNRINEVYQDVKPVEDFLPANILNKWSLIELNEALQMVHYPKTLEEAKIGRERLAFNELLFLQLKSLYRKNEWKNNNVSHQLTINNKIIEQFLAKLPYALTESQKRSINEIIEDFKKNIPMNRLLEGDVGSGKTVVAATAAFIAFVSGYQSVFMAPTQILAQQHYLTLQKLFSNFKIRVSLITASDKETDLGKTDIYVGTHALIHKKANFDSVALVVIDEQHRFGVEQRSHLVKKSQNGLTAPHVLTMTATPIPRTIALTIYGDLDLSTLDELPSGRKPITTWVVPPQKRAGAYNWIKKSIRQEHIQVFIVCPLIEESDIDTMKQVKAATQEFANLKNIFSQYSVGLLHGKQKNEEKNNILTDFKNKKIDILVSTPVVEVGIDIPNATIMMIETAERFGLAQLHQLRGRVGRGDKKSYCLLMTESKTQKALTRLSALTKTVSGFELAELDLKLRGPGEIIGTRQHGFDNLKVASWQDIDLIRKAKAFAEDVIKYQSKYRSVVEKINFEKLVLN
jgi:ATP-dependent DNA helicase RecG